MRPLVIIVSLDFVVVDLGLPTTRTNRVRAAADAVRGGQIPSFKWRAVAGLLCYSSWRAPVMLSYRSRQ